MICDLLMVVQAVCRIGSIRTGVFAVRYLTWRLVRRGIEELQRSPGSVPQVSILYERPLPDSAFLDRFLPAACANEVHPPFMSAPAMP